MSYAADTYENKGLLWDNRFNLMISHIDNWAMPSGPQRYAIFTFMCFQNKWTNRIMSLYK